MISNKELLTEDNVLTRTSLPLSVAQSTLPFRMTQSELLTLLTFCLPHLLSTVLSDVCTSPSLLWHSLLLLLCAFLPLPSLVESDEG